MRNILTLPVIASTLLVFMLTGCNARVKSLGYGMLLWPQPLAQGGGAQDGDVVLVLAKSNISKTWIVELTRGNTGGTGSGQNGAGERFEVPLWALAGPMKDADARVYASQYSPWQGKGAKTTSDGLPIRAAPSNSAKRVYRLKKGQVVNVLRKWQSQEHDGPMEVPTNGGVPLEGEWLFVVTADGGKGWCFSHNLSECQLVEESGNEDM